MVARGHGLPGSCRNPQGREGARTGPQLCPRARPPSRSPDPRTLGAAGITRGAPGNVHRATSQPLALGPQGKQGWWGWEGAGGTGQGAEITDTPVINWGAHSRAASGDSCWGNLPSSLSLGAPHWPSGGDLAASTSFSRRGPGGRQMPRRSRGLGAAGGHSPGARELARSPYTAPPVS